MRYAMLINNRLKYWTGHITVDDKDIFATDPRPWGYKEYVIPTAPIQDGYYAVADGWDETETQIIQRWRLEPIPEPEITPDDALAELSRLGVDTSD